MRFAATIALVLLCSSAQAADPWVPFRKMFPGKAPPVAVEPLPPILPPELPPPPVIMLPEPELPAPPVIAPPSDPKSPAVLPKPKPKPRAARPLQLQPSLPGDPDYISCEEARQGVGMSCEKLRRWAWVYNGYSERKKANSQACLTAAERARIKACFVTGGTE